MLKLHSQPAIEPATRPDKAEKPKKAPAEPAVAPKPSKKVSVTEPKPESAAKPAGLGSFFKKILPGSGEKPKK
jgi:hypothetical protein